MADIGAQLTQLRNMVSVLSSLSTNCTPLDSLTPASDANKREVEVARRSLFKVAIVFCGLVGNSAPV
eukprot:scaffold7052_cov254-Pinguiococcus_pyrenoidosus.AAC.27